MAAGDQDYPFHSTETNTPSSDNAKDPRSLAFVPATSAQPGLIVLNRCYNDYGLSKKLELGFRGLVPLRKDDVLQGPSYNHQPLVGEICAAHQEVRFIITPDSDITIIPMNLNTNFYELRKDYDVVGTMFLKPAEAAPDRHSPSSEDFVEVLKGGLKINVRLEFFVGEVILQRCIVDGAVLFDPNQNIGQLPYDLDSKTFCFLGMDWLTKYPYILLEPILDHIEGLDFKMSTGPTAARANTIHLDLRKQLIIYVEGRENGCGVFFASGSIYNTFCAVSRCNIWGEGHEKYQKERAVLMAFLKAIQIIENFHALGHKFDSVSIRSTDPIITGWLDPYNSCLTPEVTECVKNVAEFHHDLWTTYQAQNAVKFLHITYLCISGEGYNCSGARAARALAELGSEMVEFQIEVRTNVKLIQSFGHKLSIANFKLRCLAQRKDLIFPLLEASFHATNPVYTTLTIDGNFYIDQDRVLKSFAHIDEIGVELSREEIIAKLGYIPWNGEVDAGPNGFLDPTHYKYVPFPRALPPMSETIRDSSVYSTFLRAVKCNPKAAAEKFQRIIWGPGVKDNLKPFAFLATATKEYRDELLNIWKVSGLDEGWEFCVDRNWEGYLRNYSNVCDIYEDCRRTRVEGKVTEGEDVGEWKDVGERKERMLKRERIDGYGSSGDGGCPDLSKRRKVD